MKSLSINRERLQNDIQELADIGRKPDYGIYRMAFTDGDMLGREWFKQRVEDAGLEFYQDGAANLFARHNWDGERPSVMMGSHFGPKIPVRRPC